MDDIWRDIHYLICHRIWSAVSWDIKSPDVVKYIINHADIQAVFYVPTTLNIACSFMLCDLDFEPLSLSLSSMPSCDLVSLTNMLILLHYLESFKSELAEQSHLSDPSRSAGVTTHLHSNPSDKILNDPQEGLSINHIPSMDVICSSDVVTGLHDIAMAD
ncbi:hypothetical protein Tco_0198987 [Tanacetum coccineum]